MYPCFGVGGGITETVTVRGGFSGVWFMFTRKITNVDLVLP